MYKVSEHSAMDSEIDIQNFINCTQEILGRQRAWEHLNVTQILDALSSQVLEDINLK